jgi:magnesium transporter
MRPSLHAPAPSASLLRFLRAQSEGLCHSSRPTGFSCRASRAPRPASIPSRQCRNYGAGSLPQRAPTTTCPQAPARSTTFPTGGHSRPFNANRTRPQAAHDYIQVTVAVIGRRQASTGHGWLASLFGQARKSPRGLESDDLPLASLVEPSASDTPMFNLGRNLAPKSANEAKLRCTEFDENGNIVLVNGEVKKSELIAKVCYSTHCTSEQTADCCYSLAYCPAT